MTTARKKVFIIDDSVLIRYALTQLINQESDIIVVGDGSSNSDISHQIDQSKPDILVFDIPLPREQGIRQLKSLNKFRLPSIVFTKSDANIAQDLIPLLEAGAVGFVLKPKEDGQLSTVKEQLLHEIRINTEKIDKIKLRLKLNFLDPSWVVAIGSSTGGPEALMDVVPHFPADFKAGVAIVQHMPADFTPRFAQRLHHGSQLSVKEAQDGDYLKSGLALLAPGGYHLAFKEKQLDRKRLSQVKLNQDPPQWGLRPTVDQMFKSLAPIYGKKMIAVVLTGMGEDGVIGARAVKMFGGHTIVQNKQTSVVFGMAQEVIKNNLADEVLPLKSIAHRVMEIVGL